MTFLLLALRWAGGALKSVSWRVWAAAGFVIVVMLLWSAHTAAVSTARSAGFTNGRADATTAFVAAQAKSARLATIEKQAKEAQYETARAKSAEAYADLSGRYRAAVLRITPRPDPSRSRALDLRGHAEGARLPENPPSSALVSVSQSDALICADNTAYATAAFEWAGRLEGPADAR